LLIQSNVLFYFILFYFIFKQFIFVSVIFFFSKKIQKFKNSKILAISIIEHAFDEHQVHPIWFEVKVGQKTTLKN